ncbi:hypothetical protein NL676_020211 [Syzygium grande]|nr:hypothetical protein NL676_020211 [Syzygium grande]
MCTALPDTKLPCQHVCKARELHAKNAFGNYSLINNNCEHFATFCQTDIRRSEQTAFVSYCDRRIQSSQIMQLHGFNFRSSLQSITVIAMGIRDLHTMLWTLETFTTKNSSTPNPDLAISSQNNNRERGEKKFFEQMEKQTANLRLVSAFLAKEPTGCVISRERLASVMIRT